MDYAKPAGETLGIFTLPNDFCKHSVGAKYLIEYNFYVMADMIIKMDINCAGLMEQIVERHGRLVEPLQIRI